MGAKADAKRRWLVGAILVMLASALPGCGGHGRAACLAGERGGSEARPVARGNDPVARAACPRFSRVSTCRR